MTTHKILLPSALCALLGMMACGEAKFKISGTVDGAGDTSLVLEKGDFNGRWVAIDSTRTSASGEFSLSSPAPAAPEVYRLRLGDRFVYFPVDSVESISLATTSGEFGTRYTLDGSDNARMMAAFDADLHRFAPHVADADSAEAFKRRVFTSYIMPAPAAITSYYVLTKTLDDTPLFDPAAEGDYRYFAAVATAFKQFRPDDPHTALLEETSLRALRERNSRKGKQRRIEAPEMGYIEITLPDESGTQKSLSSVIGKGRPAILVFSALTDQSSPAEHRILSGASGNVAIFHVGIDADQYAWRDAARNLPWTTVFDPAGGASESAAAYNVTGLPTYFIFDAAGNLVDRASTASQAVSKAR